MYIVQIFEDRQKLIFTFAAGGDSDDFYYNYDCTTALDKMAMINAIKEVRKGNEQFSHNNDVAGSNGIRLRDPGRQHDHGDSGGHGSLRSNHLPHDQSGILCKLDEYGVSFLEIPFA